MLTGTFQLANRISFHKRTHPQEWNVQKPTNNRWDWEFLARFLRKQELLFLPQDFSHQFPLICSLSYVVQFFFSFRNAILETLIVFKSSTVNEIKPWAVTLGYVHSIHHNRHDQTIDRSIDHSSRIHPLHANPKSFDFIKRQKNWFETEMVAIIVVFDSFTNYLTNWLERLHCIMKIDGFESQVYFRRRN